MQPNSRFPSLGSASLAAAVAAGVISLAAPGLLGQNPDATVVVDANHPGARISPTMWGVFFEDINFGADGGLYAELVKNRGFEFPEPLTGWSESVPAGGAGSLAIHDDAPFNPANPHYLRLTATAAPGYGVINEGFRGMGVRAGETYLFSTQLRVPEGKPAAIRVELIDPAGAVLGSARIEGTAGGNGWSGVTAGIKPAATCAKARLKVLVEGAGVVDLDMVSLFPEKTWKNRPGGLRADMVNMLAEMKPGFVRFPGGCIVEGHYLTNRYQWKTTIGPVAERRLIMNRWNDEFKHRPAPDYYQSFGLGFFEFFQMCEDIGAEPLPILNCGMACQFNSGELVPLDQLDPYIQDALDLIEYANGGVTTPWGAKRAAAGHPAPFKLKMMGVGNEQWGMPYMDRYPKFAQAIHQRHPEIQLVASAGPAPADNNFRLAWANFRQWHADIVDEHCYAAPSWFLENDTRYDRYDRKGPKVFMGEYAAQSSGVAKPDNTNNLECALAEAAYLTGLERNAEVVRMASYAPLFGQVDAWQWTPNLIWCDNLRVWGTPSYFVQQLFARNRGDRVLPTMGMGVGRVYANAVWDEAAGEIILKVVNPARTATVVATRLSGVLSTGATMREFELAGAGPREVNSADSPNRVRVRSSEVEGVRPDFIRTFKPWSMTVLRIPAKIK